MREGSRAIRGPRLLVNLAHTWTVLRISREGKSVLLSTVGGSYRETAAEESRDTDQLKSQPAEKLHRVTYKCSSFAFVIFSPKVMAEARLLHSLPLCKPHIVNKGRPLPATFVKSLCPALLSSQGSNAACDKYQTAFQNKTIPPNRHCNVYTPFTAFRSCGQSSPVPH